MTNLLEDTICAISTAPGVGGIAVIRVSGKQATECVGQCWEGASIASMASHTAHLGRITDSDGSILDEVVLTIFRGPRSFTGEDVIEIACHGSTWIQQQIINTLIKCGCRQAEGGEFTRRAFSNGRMDLSQAEAVADIIAADSQAALRVASTQMRGGYSDTINSLRDQLINLTALLERKIESQGCKLHFVFGQQCKLLIREYQMLGKE